MKEKPISRKIAEYIVTAASLLTISQVNCYVLPQERCAPSGHFEGVINGGGGPLEVYSAVLFDQICGLFAHGLESLAAQE